MMNQAQSCPNCGKPLGPGALEGLCPACLLVQGAQTETEHAEHSTRFVPPTRERIAGLFPQLEVLALLGAGGMGAVYKARQPALDRLVALKVLPTTDAQGASFEERFNREARALARLSHPNIVTVHEFGETGGLHYFVMEFVDGTNLRQLESSGRLSPREALQIIPQICDALQYAHDEGVVHRDIKPENVLVDRKGRVKIADFGLARIMGQDSESLRLTQEGQVMGTPHYMAPEQIEHPLAVDHRADIYSLGVVFYEMLTGDLPLGKFPPPSRKVQMDIRLDEVVLRALENDPERRYQKASEVKSEVATIAETPASAGSAVTPPEEPRYITWAGFRLVKIAGGARVVNWPGTALATAVIFGVLTIGFGLVTLVSGRSLMGWLGVAGWPSVAIRLLIALVAVAWGLRLAMRSPPPPQIPPKVPNDTVVLTPERLSRKAIVGACWAPMFLVATVLWFMPPIISEATVETEVPVSSGHVVLWWHWVMIAVILVPGLAAPFGTTILGWLAVRDIRRAGGRLGGLPLALFDGLLFPLVALDLLLCFVLLVTPAGSDVGLMGWTFQSKSTTQRLMLAFAFCALADYWIVRRAWNAAKPGNSSSRTGAEWWWSGKTGAALIGIACVAVLLAVGSRREQPGGLRTPVYQFAERDGRTGALAANLPGGGRVEVVAIGYRDAAPNQWWRPDGTLIEKELWQIENPGEANFMNRTNRDMVIRLSDLPEGMTQTALDFGVGSGYASGGRVLRNNAQLHDAIAVRLAIPTGLSVLDMRIGFGVQAWRTIATHRPKDRAVDYLSHPGDPIWNTSFNNVSDTSEGAQITVVMSAELPDWNRRVVAVDEDGAEHTRSSANGTPRTSASTWTYTFHNLPLAKVREFRVQVQPVYWVGFPGLQLDPCMTLPAARPLTFTVVRDVSLTGFIDFDTGNTEEPTTATPAGFNDAAAWAGQRRLDAAAGIGELQTIGMVFVALENQQWESLSPVELTTRLAQGMFQPNTLKPWKNGELPSTFGFRTREGGTGMLQLLGFVEARREVSLRYKLIKPPEPGSP
jgi:predicted Ser/Thr protein kinase